MDQETLDKHLEHFGVLGMKWGVRRDRGNVTRLKRGATSSISPDAARANESQNRARKSGTASLSDSELQSLINRMNMEQQYSNLNSKQSLINKGNARAQQILKTGNTIGQVAALANGPLGRLIIKKLNK